MNVKFRQRIERLITRRFIVNALAAGYAITVNDGEEDVLERSHDQHAILGAMFTTDEDRLFLERNNFGCGWVRFIYGNDGWDVVNDYTTNLQSIMDNVEKTADRLEKMFA